MPAKRSPRNPPIAPQLDLEGKSIEDDWRYRYFFTFLQMSPSYWAVHRERQGETGLLLPKDAKTVERVYDDFGDVYGTYFAEWWARRGRRGFGRVIPPMPPQIIWQGMKGAFDVGSLQEAFNAKWITTAPQGSDMPLVILAVPLAGSAKGILRQIAARIGEVENLRASSDATVAKYRLSANKTREKTLADARRVFRARLALPKAQLWKLGNRVKLAAHYVTDGNAKATRDVGDSREMMAIIVSRQLRRAHLYAENAARGIFPSLAPTPSVPFDVPSQRLWLRNYRKFLEAEVARIKALQQQVRRSGHRR